MTLADYFITKYVSYLHATSLFLLLAAQNACVIKGSAGQKGFTGQPGGPGPEGQKGKTRIPI